MIFTQLLLVYYIFSHYFLEQELEYDAYFLKPNNRHVKI